MNELSKYRSLISTLLFFSIVSLLVTSIFKNVFIAYIASFIVEEYTYLIILLPSSLWLIIYMLMNYFDVVGLGFERLVPSVMLFLASLIFFIIYLIFNENILQYGILSFLLLVMSFVILIYKPRKLVYYIVFIYLLLSLIPIPLSWISEISTIMSHIMGRVAAFLTGSELVVMNNRVMLSLNDVDGIQRMFEVSFACSGIISLTSVLAISPIVVYLALRSYASPKRKVYGIFLALMLSSLITLLGNLIRLILILLVTRYYSYDLALEIFHQSPSLIYVSIAVLTAFIVLDRSLGRVYLVSKAKRVRTSATLAPLLRSSLALSFVILIFLSLTYVGVVNIISENMFVQEYVKFYSFDAVLSNPTDILFNGTGVRVIVSKPSPSLTTLLGSSIVIGLRILYEQNSYSGYLEIAETPSRFHGWYVCLTFQGYKIVRSWTVLSNTTINYILLEKNKRYTLLGYTIYRLPVVFGNTTGVAYIRLSLFGAVFGNNYDELVNRMNKLFNTLTIKSIRKTSSGPWELMEVIVILENIMVIANIIVVIIIIIKKYGERLSIFLKRVHAYRI